MYFTHEKVLRSGLLATILMVSAAIIAIIITGVNQFKIGSQLAGMSQVTNLSHLLVRQQANLFSLMLVKNAKNEELVEALEGFAKENFVIDANIYAPNGLLIAQSKNALDLEQALKLNNELATQQIVEPIYAQQNLVGFLRVTFDAQYAQSGKSRVDALFKKLYGELIILIFVGLLIASSIHYFLHKRTVHHIANRTIKPKVATKSQTQRFYSRRRGFGRK